MELDKVQGGKIEALLMTKKERIRRLLKFCIERGYAASQSCGSVHIAGIINQVRGALWLETGKDPGFSIDDMKDVADFLHLRYVIKNNTIHFRDYRDL